MTSVKSEIRPAGQVVSQLLQTHQDRVRLCYQAAEALTADKIEQAVVQAEATNESASSIKVCVSARDILASIKEAGHDFPQQGFASIKDAFKALGEHLKSKGYIVSEGPPGGGAPYLTVEARAADPRSAATK